MVRLEQESDVMGNLTNTVSWNTSLVHRDHISPIRVKGPECRDGCTFSYGPLSQERAGASAVALGKWTAYLPSAHSSWDSPSTVNSTVTWRAPLPLVASQVYFPLSSSQTA